MANLDLAMHAVNKVRRALDDVMQLAETPEQRLEIALLASTVPVGQAAAVIAKMFEAQGIATNQAHAVGQVLSMLRLTSEGADAVLAKLKEMGHG